MHYNPSWNFSEDSQKQEVINPEYKSLKNARKVAKNLPCTNTKKIRKERTYLEKEGKTWWNLAEMIFWNSRKKLSAILYTYLSDHRDLLPVLDAITSSKGWIKSTKDTLIIRIEPLDSNKYKYAQIQLCRYLNSKKNRLPNGKLIQYDVAIEPENVQY